MKLGVRWLISLRFYWGSFSGASIKSDKKLLHVLNVQQIGYYGGGDAGLSITFIALFLGQSRFALAGVFIGLVIVIVFVLSNWKSRIIGLGIWGIFVVLEILIVTQVLPLNSSSTPPDESSQSTPTVLNERDERTLSTRFELWDRALQMVRDYPNNRCRHVNLSGDGDA